VKPPQCFRDETPVLKLSAFKYRSKDEETPNKGGGYGSDMRNDSDGDCEKKNDRKDLLVWLV
jgi:hypothetical protein